MSKRKPAASTAAQKKRARVTQPSTDATRICWEKGPASGKPLTPKCSHRVLLERILSPISTKQFLQDVWAQRALAIAGPTSRLKPLTDEFLFGMDLGALVANSPSEQVHCWVRSSGSKKEPLESLKVDEDTALTLYKAGASLYFRAPQNLADLLVSKIATALGMAFTSQGPGGNLRGEIETFVSRKGHVTEWHTDFQHNFTIQLTGRKVWKFKKGPVDHNLRALSPHFADRSNYEQQMKLHLMSSPSRQEFRPPDSFFSDAEQVEVCEGGVLYHPAGIWHRVECVSDEAVSINVSLTTAPWAEVLTDALHQALWARPEFRAPVVQLPEGGFHETLARVERMLADFKNVAAQLRPEDFISREILCPPGPSGRRHTVDVTRSGQGRGLKIAKTDQFRFSKVAVLVPLPEDAASSSGSDDCDSEEENSTSRQKTNPGARARKIYVLHVNFGNEDKFSWLRVRLRVPTYLDSAVTWLLKHHNPVTLFAAEDVWPKPARVSSGKSKEPQNLARWKDVEKLLQILWHNGYIYKESPR